jgi:polyphenol oxidase
VAPPAGWILPQWPAPPGVRALCTTREGGVSRGPYASFNLGEHVGDEAHAVDVNRRTLAAEMRARPVFLQQVHGNGAVQLDDGTPDGVVADACLTSQAGVACTIMVADCLPVLFALRDGRAVAAAHAGWRGLAGTDGRGVLESVCHELWAAAGAGPDDTLAWLGPCIGPSAFEVGAEVKAAFAVADPGAAECFRPHADGKWLADLAGLARRRLKALGVRCLHGNDGSQAWCTVSNPSRFFSHRRDRGSSGRFAAAIWRV